MTDPAPDMSLALTLYEPFSNSRAELDYNGEWSSDNAELKRRLTFAVNETVIRLLGGFTGAVPFPTLEIRDCLLSIDPEWVIEVMPPEAAYDMDQFGSERLF